jgi:hypothetical protein
MVRHQPVAGDNLDSRIGTAITPITHAASLQALQ